MSFVRCRLNRTSLAGPTARKAWAVLVALLSAGACTLDSAGPNTSKAPASGCALGQTTLTALQVTQCLYDEGLLSDADNHEAHIKLNAATTLRDTYAADTGGASFWRAAELSRAMQRLSDYYARGLYPDSTRFHRMLDHVQVTEEYISGTLRWNGSYAWPATTPYLSWSYYPNQGIHFQPVNTVQSVASLFPRPGVPTDSLLGMGEALYHYAIWRQAPDGRRFPVWEYNFTWTSGGVTVLAPWVSSQAQGYGLILFAELYRRTGDPVWRDRAFQTLTSFEVSWDDGGVLLPDTTHGYWWEEFHPTVMIWNGAAQALLGVGELWQATGDSSVKRLFDRGIEAMKYYTPLFDTGTWTLYSRTQWYNTVAYHESCIRIMEALAQVSGDSWFQTVADRWKTYTPPPGVT